MTLHAAHAVFFNSKGEPLAAAAAIHDVFQKALQGASPPIRTHRLSAEQSGTLAFASGEYRETLVSGGQTSEVRGHYVLVLRQEDGRWLILERIWSEAPAGK